MIDFETKPYRIKAARWHKAGDHPAVVSGAVIAPRVQTRQGWVAVDPGDWIITLPDGESYPCKPDVFEAKYRPAVAASSGVELIAAERRRQVDFEGYDAEHDKRHEVQDFVDQAVYYATEGAAGTDCMCEYKPKNRLRDLVRAGALIAAAIDRLTAAEGGGR